MDVTSTQSGWMAQLAMRLSNDPLLKAFGTMGYIAAFFYAYFWLLRNPLFDVFTMPATAIDDWVPFSSNWLPAYLSLWVYVSLVPAMMATRTGLIRYGITTFLLCASGLTIFALWPTTIPTGLLDPDQQAQIPLLQGMDVAGNACPSMHVASAIFTAIWLRHLLNEIQAPASLQLLNAVWCSAIIYSTMAVKQHVFLDVAGGLLLGIPLAVLGIRWHIATRPGEMETQPAR